MSFFTAGLIAFLALACGEGAQSERAPSLTVNGTACEAIANVDPLATGLTWPRWRFFRREKFLRVGSSVLALTDGAIYVLPTESGEPTPLYRYDGTVLLWAEDNGSLVLYRAIRSPLRFLIDRIDVPSGAVETLEFDRADVPVAFRWDPRWVDGRLYATQRIPAADDAGRRDTQLQVWDPRIGETRVLEPTLTLDQRRLLTSDTMVLASAELNGAGPPALSIAKIDLTLDQVHEVQARGRAGERLSSVFAVNDDSVFINLSTRLDDGVEGGFPVFARRLLRIDPVLGTSEDIPNDRIDPQFLRAIGSERRFFLERSQADDGETDAYRFVQLSDRGASLSMRSCWSDLLYLWPEDFTPDGDDLLVAIPSSVGRYDVLRLEGALSEAAVTRGAMRDP